MVDFFSNLNSKIVQPILGNVAEKAGELQDNGQVDLPVLQNIAGQLGISEEKYEKIEDGLFGLAEGVLSAAAPILDKVAPVADQVFDMLLQSLGNGKFTAVSSTANAQNNAEPATAEAQVEEEPETIQQPAQQPVDDVQKDNPVSNNGLLSDAELANRKDQIDKAFASGITADFEKAWNDMTPEQQAPVMQEYNGDMLRQVSKFSYTTEEKQALLNSISANVANTENGSQVLAKELDNLLNSQYPSDSMTINSILNNPDISSANSLKVMKEYNKIVNPTSDPEGRSLIDDIYSTKSLSDSEKNSLFDKLSNDIKNVDPDGLKYSTEKDKIGKAKQMLVDDKEAEIKKANDAKMKAATDALKTGNSAEIEKAFASLDSELMAQMLEKDPNMLRTISTAFNGKGNRQAFLDGVVDKIADSKNGAVLLAKAIDNSVAPNRAKDPYVFAAILGNTEKISRAQLTDITAAYQEHCGEGLAKTIDENFSGAQADEYTNNLACALKATAKNNDYTSEIIDRNGNKKRFNTLEVISEELYYATEGYSGTCDKFLERLLLPNSDYSSLYRDIAKYYDNTYIEGTKKKTLEKAIRLDTAVATGQSKYLDVLYPDRIKFTDLQFFSS